MGWETRNGKQVYIRKRRIGDKVVSIYVGPGEKGMRAAQDDEFIRAHHQAVIARQTAYLAEIDEARRRVEAGYAAKGLHRDSRGRWLRNRRGRPPKSPPGATPAKSIQISEAQSADATNPKNIHISAPAQTRGPAQTGATRPKDNQISEPEMPGATNRENIHFIDPPTPEEMAMLVRSLEDGVATITKGAGSSA